MEGNNYFGDDRRGVLQFDHSHSLEKIMMMMSRTKKYSKPIPYRNIGSVKNARFRFNNAPPILASINVQWALDERTVASIMTIIHNNR